MAVQSPTLTSFSHAATMAPPPTEVPIGGSTVTSSSGLSGFNTVTTHFSITNTTFNGTYTNHTLTPAIATVATFAPASISVIVDPVSSILQLQPPAASNVSDITSWCTDACLIRAGYALTTDLFIVTGLDGQLSSTTFSAVFSPTYQVNALSTEVFGCMLSYGIAMQPSKPTLIVLTSDVSADFSSAAALYFSAILATESCGHLPSTLVLERDYVASTSMSTSTADSTNAGDGGLSTGAKVGIGIAVSIVGLVILGSVIFIAIYRRRNLRRERQSGGEFTEAPMTGAALPSDKLEPGSADRPEKDGIPVSELAPTRRYELDSGPVGWELHADHGTTELEHHQARS